MTTQRYMKEDGGTVRKLINKTEILPNVMEAVILVDQ
jgi:hypothetical protein